MATMLKFIHLVLLGLMVGSALAQSSLQPCKGNQSNWTNCFGSFIDVNGNGYDGQFKDGKMHGQGESSLASGNKYAGEYRNGLFSGQGITRCNVPVTEASPKGLRLSRQPKGL